MVVDRDVSSRARSLTGEMDSLEAELELDEFDQACLDGDESQPGMVGQSPAGSKGSSWINSVAEMTFCTEDSCGDALIVLFLEMSLGYLLRCGVGISHAYAVASRVGAWGTLGYTGSLDGATVKVLIKPKLLNPNPNP